MKNVKITRQNLKEVSEAVRKCLQNHGWHDIEVDVFSLIFTLKGRGQHVVISDGDVIMYLSDSEEGGMVAIGGKEGFFLSILTERISLFSFDGEEYTDIWEIRK